MRYYDLRDYGNFDHDEKCFFANQEKAFQSNSLNDFRVCKDCIINNAFDYDGNRVIFVQVDTNYPLPEYIRAIHLTNSPNPYSSNNMINKDTICYIRGYKCHVHQYPGGMEVVADERVTLLTDIRIRLFSTFKLKRWNSKAI